MPLSDKEIALRLLDMIEELVVQKLALESVLEFLHGDEWDSVLRKMEQYAAVRDVIHAKTQPLRQRVLDAPDLSSVVREMVEGLERIDPEEKD
jgi:hypothetical protein